MIDYAHFTPWASLAGGALIGLASSLLLLANGHVAGVSGILGSAVRHPSRAGAWRWAFLLGLVCGGTALAFALPSAVAPSPRSMITVAVAGLLVGLGTGTGSGCTSGHGVCGLSRFSPRSLVATLTFIATGAAAVLATRLLGGAQ